MHNQINKLRTLLLILALFGIGYPSNTVTNSRKQFERNFAANYFAADIPAGCEETPSKILREINNSPPALKDQFVNKNITYEYDSQRLAFKGYVQGNGNVSRLLINGFNKLRDAKCIRVISFEGKSSSESFEWRAESTEPNPPAPEKCDVGSVISRSILGEQLGKTFFYEYDGKTRILELKGRLGDAPGKGRFNSLIAQLQKYMNNGCLGKIQFKPQKSVDGTQMQSFPIGTAGSAIINIAFAPESNLLNILMPGDGFEWQICEYPACECGGGCPPCTNC